MPLGNETLAYVAGLFDGEGCVNFGISGYHNTVVLRVTIVNTDKGIIEFLTENFGGKVRVKQWRYNNWKDSYHWRLDGEKAVIFLQSIEPWVRIKKDQLLVASFWDVVRNRTNRRDPDPQYPETIALLVRQLHWLNRKGRRSEDDVEPIEECLATLPVPVEQILRELGYAAN